MTLADLGDTGGFDQDGKEDRLYAFQLSEGQYKRKEITFEEAAPLAFGGLSDVDISHAVPKQIHSLAFTGSKWVAFADPVQKTGWLYDIRIASPYVATGKGHKVRKVLNSGTRLCSLIPETRNIIVSEGYMLKTSNARRGILKMVSEFPPAGFIGLGLQGVTILLEIFLGDRPDDYVDVLPGLKLKWPQKHANKKLGVHIVVKEIIEMTFTLNDIQGQNKIDILDIDKIFLGPVSFHRLRLTPGELTPDQAAAIVD